MSELSKWFGYRRVGEDEERLRGGLAKSEADAEEGAICRQCAEW